jgi:hypothetical protein
VHKDGDPKQRRQSLGLASRMVAASRRAAEAEAAAAAAAGGGTGGGTLADAFTALQEFGIAARRGDAEGLRAALAAAAGLACVGAEHLLRMAAVVEDPEFRWGALAGLPAGSPPPALQPWGGQPSLWSYLRPAIKHVRRSTPAGTTAQGLCI